MAAIVHWISRLGLLTAALILTLSIHVAHAQNQGGNSQGGNQGGNSQGGGGGGGNHGGPAPLIGGGLPAVLLIGAGAYLAYRRSRPTN